MPGDERAPRRGRVEPAPLRLPAEPAHPGRDMADLFLVDAPERGGALLIAEALHARDHVGRDVEAARLEDERDDGEPGEEVVARLDRRLPEPVMRRKVAIGGAERG